MATSIHSSSSSSSSSLYVLHEANLVEDAELQATFAEIAQDLAEELEIVGEFPPPTLADRALFGDNLYRARYETDSSSSNPPLPDFMWSAEWLSLWNKEAFLQPLSLTDTQDGSFLFQQGNRELHIRGNLALYCPYAYIHLLYDEPPNLLFCSQAAKAKGPCEDYLHSRKPQLGASHPKIFIFPKGAELIFTANHQFICLQTPWESQFFTATHFESSTRSILSTLSASIKK